jgi:hypothetical protein
MATGMIIDGVVASEAIDSSGEILSVEGCDISSLPVDGVLNYEHKGDEEKGASFNDVIGKCVYARKIFSEKDCEDSRQKAYWKEVQLPFIYAKFRLYDGSGHDNAKAAAAIIRDHAANGEPILIRYSIEGSILERDPKNKNHITGCVARRVAATIKPCNRSCHSGIVSDPGAASAVSGQGSKSDGEDKIASLVYKKEHVHPGCTPLGGHESVTNPCLRDEDRVQAALAQIEDIKKTLAAGSYNAMPGTLTGGAALQREDSSLKMFKASVKAAVRDWDGTGDFKKFLKSRLGEVDPEFIDRFADLVEDYRVKKAELAKVDPGIQGSAQHLLAQPVDMEPEIDERDPDPNSLPKGATSFPYGKNVKKPRAPRAKKAAAQTKVAAKVQAAPSLPPVRFDENTGTLTTPKGQFKVFIPKDETYRNILESPEIQNPIADAVKHWRQLNDLAREKKLPDEVIMHAAILSGLSANESVPVQELAFGHVQDVINRGYDPRKGPMPDNEKATLSRQFENKKYPEYMREHYQGPGGAGARTQKGKGDLRIVGLGDQKINSVDKYHRMHGRLKELFQQHGDDGNAIVEEMLKHKVEWENWKTREASRKEKGQPGQEPYSVPVEQFKNKTVRYLVAMAGPGNIHVPDTHFLRHFFGLKLKDQANLDVKDAVWNPNYREVLNGMDRYFMIHHPAYQSMIQRHFGGRPTPQAIFPAFWLHWLTIVPHERAMNLPTMGENEGTDHSVFFNIVNQVLKKHGIQPAQDYTKKNIPNVGKMMMPLRTAMATHEISQKYGEAAAAFAFHAFMVPALMASRFADGLRKSEELVHASYGDPEGGEFEKTLCGLEEKPHRVIDHNKLDDGYEKIINCGGCLKRLAEHKTFALEKKDPEVIVRKFEKMTLNLAELIKGLPAHVTFGDNAVKPGEATSHMAGEEGRKYHVLHADDKGFIVAPQEEDHDFDMNTQWHELKRWPKEKMGTHFTVHSMPYNTSNPLRVDSTVHGIPHFTQSPEAHALIHDLDLSENDKAPKHVTASANESTSRWVKHPNGGHVFVKYDMMDQDHREGYMKHAHREAAFYHLAKNYFGLGDYVPLTTAFKHPVTGEDYSAQAPVPGAEHGVIHQSRYPREFVDPFHNQVLHELGDSGELDKLQMMDMILGNDDRHRNNYMFSRKTNRPLQLIDHGYSFTTHDSRPEYPHYMSTYLGQRYPDMDDDSESEVHPAALNWLMSHDPAQLRHHMEQIGMPARNVDEAVRRLVSLQTKMKLNDGVLDRHEAHYTPFER